MAVSGKQFKSDIVYSTKMEIFNLIFQTSVLISHIYNVSKYHRQNSTTVCDVGASICTSIQHIIYLIKG